MTSSAPSNVALIELLNKTGKGFALYVPEQSGSEAGIQWCSEAWEHALPELTAKCSLSQVLLARDELAQLFAKLEKNGSCSGQVWCEGVRQTKLLSLSQLDSGAVALQLSDAQAVSDDMHSYMQARESMFTTSRTISVSEMATTLAHEIKQPIATITNILKALLIRLERDDLPADQLEKALNGAMEQAQFTKSVINRIRDFTQARRPSQQRIDVAKLTREALVLMDWLLSTSHCRTELIVSDEPLYCQGDPTMLEQVLINLLRNGVEAMQDRNLDDRVITVECQRHVRSVRVSIRDNGHGIEGKEKSLFVPFSTSKASGMGVGLNICRSFVELHQGRLWLAPNVDGGCTSNIELPLVLDDAAGGDSEEDGRRQA